MPNKEPDTPTFGQFASLNFYTPVVVDDIAFVVGVYYDYHDGGQFVSASDFFTALDIPKVRIENTIYHWLNKLECKEHEDYVLKPSVDPIVNAKPEYILTIITAHKIANEMNTGRSKAAAKFLEQVMNYVTFDINECVIFDIVVRNALYPLKTVADIMAIDEYNEQNFDEERLIKLLVHDRHLTRALRPTRGNETKFVYIDKQPMATVHGVQYILRRYAGHTIERALMTIVETISSGNRLKSSDLFDIERICEEITNQPEQDIPLTDTINDVA